MRISRMFCFFLILMLFASLSHATTITFDGVPDGTVVDIFYAAQGVTFSCVVCGNGSGPDVYARADGSNNVVSVFGTGAGFPYFDARWGGIQAMFTVPVNTVSIDAAAIPAAEYTGTPNNLPWIQAYGAGNVLLDSAYYPIAYGQPGYGSFQTLTISSATDIQYVIFSSRHYPGAAVYGNFDNLSFSATGGSGGPGGPGGPAVPEPSTMALVASGAFAALRGIRRKLDL